MITEDYCSFEIAKLLNEKGFDDSNCQHAYNRDGKIEKYFDPYVDYLFYGMPTLQMTMKWLREVHSLHIWIGHAAGNVLSWYYEIHGISDGKVKHIGGIQCGSYEVICEVAIKYCLKNLI
jgi:hypothetical protein